MSDDDIINLDERRPSRGRPSKPQASKSDFMKAQTVSFIAAALGLDRRTVERKLMGVAPAERQGKSDLYAFPEACKAIFRTETGLSSKALADLRPDQLPPNTQSAFWVAQDKRMDVGLKAGQFFHVDDILQSHTAKDKVFRREILALPGKIRSAEKNGQSYEDLSHEILSTVVSKAKDALRELTGKSHAADLMDVERMMEAEDDGNS